MTTRARRRSFWLDTLHNFSVASGASSNINLMAELPDSERRAASLTLARTIICWNVSYTVHDSGEGNQIVTAGIGTASQVAFGAGTVPNPDVSGDYPDRGWVYRCRWLINGYAADQPAFDRVLVEKDLRGMRKIDNSDLYLRVRNTSNIGVASAISIVGISRVLMLS